ncbi:MAG: S1 RNA-binding domain-containing protein [Phycisphaerae bacterium]
MTENQTAGVPQESAPVDASKGLDAEVTKAMQGLSLEDLMAASVQQEQPRGPRLDPQRKVRGGRPSSRRDADEGEHIHPDNNKRGKVVAIRQSSIFVEIGGKSQGMCPMDQFVVAGGDQDETPVIGQDYDFVYKGYDNAEGLVILARKGAIAHGAWETLKPGDIVEATVVGVNKGGLELKVGTAKAFMPAGMVDLSFNQDLSVFLNQRMTCVVGRVDRTSHQIVLNRKAYMEQEREKNAEAIWLELAEGQIREGVVRSVQAYGAFVDLGGVDGLLHVSAMAHNRVTDPKKIVREGDKISVMVLQVDRENKRVGLGLKQLSKDPWTESSTKYPVGTTATGTVKKLLDFGAFVELEPGVEGMIHISELASRRIQRVSEVVKEGQSVTVKVIAVDADKRRISLSMAALEREAKAASEPAAEATPASAAPTPAATPAKPVLKLAKKNLKGGL